MSSLRARQISERQKRHSEFLDQLKKVCEAQGGLCHAGDYAIVDTRVYDVKLKTKEK